MPNEPKKFQPGPKVATHFGAATVGTLAAAYAPEVGRAVKKGAKKAKKAIKNVVNKAKRTTPKRNADGVVKMKRSTSLTPKK